MKQKKQQKQTKFNSIEEEIAYKSKNQEEEIEKDLDPYKIDRLSSFPMWILILIIKWWFAGAIYYFAYMGILVQTTDGSTEAIIGGVILGAVLDILVNRVIRFIEREKGANEKYILITTKKYVSFILNMLYGLLISLFITYGVGFLVTKIAQLFGHTGSVGMEPITFGIMFVLIDLGLIKIKNLIIKSKAKRGDVSEDK